MDLDLARPRGLTPLHADLHDAVDILRLHPLRVDVFGQADDPTEFAAETLLAIVVHLVLDPDLPLARYREQILLHGDVETLGVDARGEEIDLHPLRGLAYIDRRETSPRQRSDAQG